MNAVLAAMAAYLALMFGIAAYVARNESIEAYLLNQKQTGIWLMTLSNFATIVGAGATVAIIIETYRTGVSFGIANPLALGLSTILFAIVAHKIKQIGDRHRVRTIVEFFRKRYDRKNAALMAALQIILITVWIGVQAIAIASVASAVLDTSYTAGVAAAAAITIAYTALGGLKVDLITDFIQFWIMVAVFSAMAVIAYMRTGGIGELAQHLPPGHLDLFAFGGVSWFIGILLFGGFITLANTAHWQRIFSTSSPAVARRSFVWTIPIMLVFTMIILFLGLAAAVLLPGSDPDQIPFTLMHSLLPPALAGLGFAAILAVTMSSIDSLLIGGSTIIFRELGLANRISAARLATAAFGIFGFAIAFLLPDIVQLSIITAYLAALLVPAIIAGLYTKISAEASFWSMLLPSMLLAAVYPVLGKHAFIPPVLLSIAIIVLYDPVRRRLSKDHNL